MLYPTAADSSHRGFINPGTGQVFTWGSASEGWGDYWADPAEPLAGQDLDGFMQQVVASITGIDGTLVRPRWQLEPPDLPPVGTNWAAIGVTRSTPLGYPATVEIATGNGFSQLSDQEEFDTLCSFYGPGADGKAVALRLGLMVAQNREAFQLLSVGLITTSGRTRVPTLVQQQNLMRVDITVTLRREVRQFYPVLFLLRAQASITTDTGLSVLVESPPPPPR